jgi:hypothetical protein
MTATLLGFSAVVAAALLGLLGVLRTGRAPTHLADVEGFNRLLDQTQEDRDYWRSRALDDEAALAECQAEAHRLRAEQLLRDGRGPGEPGHHEAGDGP